jgi:iron complex outermembrane receptor protein
MLDDMCRNGNISKGFKLANPQLQPEKVDNLEAGANWNPVRTIRLEPSVYYTHGTNFHYFVGNGDSVATGGDNLKPVLQRQNVSEVTVFGAEISVLWQITRNISLTANYAWNDSRITGFDTTGRAAKDLTGKFLMEVPVNQVFAGIYYKRNTFHSSLVFNYKSAQWSDDENTQQTPGYSTFDFKIGKIFLKSFNVNLVIQDIFDTPYYDSKGNISPGRFFMLNLSYDFSFNTFNFKQQNKQNF